MRLTPRRSLPTPRLAAIGAVPRRKLSTEQRWGLLFFLVSSCCYESISRLISCQCQVGLPYIRARAQDYYERLGGMLDPEAVSAQGPQIATTKVSSPSPSGVKVEPVDQAYRPSVYSSLSTHTPISGSTSLFSATTLRTCLRRQIAIGPGTRGSHFRSSAGDQMILFVIHPSRAGFNFHHSSHHCYSSLNSPSGGTPPLHLGV